MKNFYKKLLIILAVCVQFFTFSNPLSFAMLQDGDTLTLEGDHECDSLLEYYMEDYNKWSYKIVWYVYYINKEDNKKYPAFCVEPEKEGVGTGYTSYNATIRKETDNVIWRILKAGYMGSTYSKLGLECDDDLYSATKIALHCYAQNVAPYDKYILGDRSVDGNSVEEIQRRGRKVLDVANNLYNYGIHGSEGYEEAKLNFHTMGPNSIEIINNIEYYIQPYSISTNKPLKNYTLELSNFTENTKVFDNQNNQIQTLANISNSLIKVGIPTNELTSNISGNIQVKNAQIKTDPIFYCDSGLSNTQNYVTYTSGYETLSASTTLQVIPTGSFELRKVDYDNNSIPIENVEFKLESLDGSSWEIFFTDSTGYYLLENFPVGVYTLTELQTSDDYVLIPEPMEVIIEYNKMTSIVFENEKAKGSIEIVKTSEDDNLITGLPAGSPLANVVFDIYDSNCNLVSTVVTNEDGIACSPRLPKGVYFIKEVKSADGYLLCDYTFEVEITDNNQVATIFITNTSQTPEPEQPEPEQPEPEQPEPEQPEPEQPEPEQPEPEQPEPEQPEPEQPEPEQPEPEQPEPEQPEPEQPEPEQPEPEQPEPEQPEPEQPGPEQPPHEAIVPVSPVKTLPRTGF